MGEKPDQIERHIKNQRAELSDNISALEEKVKGAFDWRTQFQERPAALMGAAFVGGAILAAVLPSTSSVTRRLKSSRYSDPWSPYTNREMGQSSLSVGSAGSSRAYSSNVSASSRKSSETWDNLKGALMGLAATRVSELVEELVPGFTEHYKKAASGRPVEPFSTPASGTENSWQKPNGGADYGSHS
jgi:hypothetical protein